MSALPRIAITMATLSSLTFSTQAQAESWFEVEVFVFERESSSLEQWTNAVAPQINERAVDFITPLISTDITGVAAGLSGCSANDWSSEITPDCNDPLSSSTVRSHPSQVPFTIAAPREPQAYLGAGPILLADSQSKFKDIIRTVSRERNVKPVVHLTWQQNMESQRRSKPVRIFGGKDFSKQFDYHGQQVSGQSQTEASYQLSTNDFSTLGNMATTQHKKPVWELDGTINIYLSHYLYIESNLALRKPIQKLVESNRSEFNQFNAVNNKVEKTMKPFLQVIPLAQNRRVRSGEIHYFDHPRMGMVMQIRRMAQPTSVKPIDLGAPSYQGQPHSQSQSGVVQPYGQ
ncbi:peptidoglycan binding protein CsiV [Shewanella sp. OMA3-2]|uniref:peptidoglycan binding protein CsiV n=1 Tax=Shewanella sp. OMA3-2 TaxID=2908650 RepID=UPI001F48998D|nr:peptidoglycan binding protein CsiV [Shewanella sp. OMA3-2]UJF20826.1 peptidoglycan binding protein CsiV [Shewanella sp. OMA3-2]